MENAEPATANPVQVQELRARALLPRVKIPQIATHLDQKQLEQGLLVVAGAIASTLLAFRFAGGLGQGLLLWPVSGATLGLSLCFWSRHPRARIPLQLSGILGSLAGNFLAHMPPATAVITAMLTGLDMLIAGAILSPHVQSLDDLKKKCNLKRFLLASTACPVVSGLLGGLPVSHTLGFTFFKTVLHATLANCLGFALVLPFMLALMNWPGSRLRTLTSRTRRATLLWVVLFVLITSTVFYQSSHPFLFCIFPAMMPILLILGLEGALFIAIAVTAIGLSATLHGHGPMMLLVGPAASSRLISLQLFDWVCLATALPIGALLDDRNTTRQEAENAQSILHGFQLFNPNLTFIKDHAGCYISYNTAFADFYGIDRTAWVGRCSYDLHPTEIASGFRQQDRQILDRGQEVDLCEQFCGKDGRLQTFRHRKFAIVSANGTRFIGGIAIDMTADIENQRALSEANDRLQQLARTDPLTGLPRRQVFEERIAIEFAVARRTGRPLSLLFIDLDNFKKRNDQLGHQAGDDALQLVGRILAAIGRASDLPARFGGEEFVLLLPETTSAEACLIASRLLDTFRELDLRPQPLTASIGVAALEPYTTGWQHLVARADEAMYSAKTSGKDRFRTDRPPAELPTITHFLSAASACEPSLAAAP